MADPISTQKQKIPTDTSGKTESLPTEPSLEVTFSPRFEIGGGYEWNRIGDGMDPQQANGSVQDFRTFIPRFKIGNFQAAPGLNLSRASIQWQVPGAPVSQAEFLRARLELGVSYDFTKYVGIFGGFQMGNSWGDFKNAVVNNNPMAVTFKDDAPIVGVRVGVRLPEQPIVGPLGLGVALFYSHNSETHYFEVLDGLGQGVPVSQQSVIGAVTVTFDK